MGRLGRGCPSMFWCLGLCQFRKFWKGLYIGLAVAQWHNRRRADDHENDDEEAHPPSLLVNPICCTEFWVHFNLLLLNWETVIYIYISTGKLWYIYIYTLLYLHGRFRSKRKATYRFCFWKLLPNPDTYELNPPKPGGSPSPESTISTSRCLNGGESPSLPGTWPPRHCEILVLRKGLWLHRMPGLGDSYRFVMFFFGVRNTLWGLRKNKQSRQTKHPQLRTCRIFCDWNLVTRNCCERHEYHDGWFFCFLGKWWGACFPVQVQDVLVPSKWAWVSIHDMSVYQHTSTNTILLHVSLRTH